MPEKMNYQSNSHKKREAAEQPTREKKEKIITGEAKARKKPLGAKIKETFTGDDMTSVGDYILFDVVIPAAKAMISDAASQGVERMLFGEVRRAGSAGARPRGYSTHTSYNKMYSGPGEERPGRTMSHRARATHDFNEIILGDRGEAEGVIEMLGNLIDQYDVATVSDLYDLVGITGSFADDKWGWYDIRGAEVRRVREGYLLELPKTLPID